MKARTDYLGIDYGLGMVNIDTETGIHYGVISMHDVPFWAEESESYYHAACPNCGYDAEDYDRDAPCPSCEYEAEDGDFDFEEASAFTYEEDGYAASQGGDDTDIFVVKSPYFTYAQFCSPCAPGAGSLTSWMDADTGVKAYCFGPDWFDTTDEPYARLLPYPVYSVETGELIAKPL